jgi:hypothetical protein
VRCEIKKLSGEEEGRVIDHILKHQETIPTYDFIRKCVGRVAVDLDHLTIRLKPAAFIKLAKKHMMVSVAGCQDEYEIALPYKTTKAKRGAVVIQPADAKADIFDLPPAELKKLIQGVIWRDEHFDSMSIKDIAKRETRSEGFVGKCIFRSFEFGA